jgi:hypothetical protein
MPKQDKLTTEDTTAWQLVVTMPDFEAATDITYTEAMDFDNFVAPSITELLASFYKDGEINVFGEGGLTFTTTQGEELHGSFKVHGLSQH